MAKAATRREQTPFSPGNSLYIPSQKQLHFLPTQKHEARSSSERRQSQLCSPPAQEPISTHPQTGEVLQQCLYPEVPQTQRRQCEKAAKQLRNCLAWRHSISADNLTVNEFLGELVDGAAYLAGHDTNSRPVIIFRIKPDYPKSKVTRLVVFTLEIAIRTVPKNIDSFVILFDASLFRSGSAFMNVILVPTLKIMADYYPCRLHKAFVIDPPSIFPYLWKGMRPFLELYGDTQLVWSVDYDHIETAFDDRELGSSCRIGSKSSRFSFTVSHHLDTLKPWYLSFTETKLGDLNLNANFGSPGSGDVMRTSSTRKCRSLDTTANVIAKAWTPLPAFLQSPAAMLFRGRERNGEVFRPYLRFYRRPYDEMWYRSKIQ